MTFDEPPDGTEVPAEQDPIKALEDALERQQAAMEADIARFEEQAGETESRLEPVEEVLEPAAEEPAAQGLPAAEEPAAKPKKRIARGRPRRSAADAKQSLPKEPAKPSITPETTIGELLDKYPFLLDFLTAYRCLRKVADPDVRTRSAGITLEWVAKRSRVLVYELIYDIADEIREKTGGWPSGLPKAKPGPKEMRPQGFWANVEAALGCLLAPLQCCPAGFILMLGPAALLALLFVILLD